MSRVHRLFYLLIAIVGIGVPSTLHADEAFSIDDYFKLKRVTELALSSNGEQVAYAVESQALDENNTVRAVYISAASQGAVPVQLEVAQDARSLAWVPCKEELAFVSDRDTAAQVFSYDLKSKSIRRLTDSAEPVTKFRIAPDGTLAYITQAQSESASLYEQMKTGDEGLIIDPDLLRVQHFTDARWRYGEPKPHRRLWLAGENGAAPVDLPGEAIDFHWASDSARLAITYDSGEPSTSIFSRYRTSLGTYDVENGLFRMIAEAAPIRPGAPGLAYDSYGWHGVNMLIVRRAMITDIFVSPRHPQWAVIDLSKGGTLEEEDLTWRELSLTGLDPRPLFHSLPNGRMLINKTVRGGYRSLYEVSQSIDLKRSDIARDLAGNISLISFSADGNRAVFVHDSLTEPPEIQLWRQGANSIRLTDLNRELAERRRPVAREIEWKSKDGTRVLGWLLLPDTPTEAPFPLVTFVHGGPSLPMPTEFACYFSCYGGIWPYPFDVYAANGLAVFFANYRGNTTFGRAFAVPDNHDGEPVDDIIAGIEHLIREGIADPKLLAISGHSHGAWLAPMVMTRYKGFTAASFAEGGGNYITVYELSPGRVNRELHNDEFGASLYDDPELYLQLSPVLHFKGLKTATLFEAGSLSSAIFMMGYPKAARAAGLPAEFIIYPQTGHNLSIPRTQKESAVYNLDWFRFWLQGYEDPDPSKRERYERWRKLKDNRNSK